MHHPSGTVYLIPINMSAININAGFTKNMGQLIRIVEEKVRDSFLFEKKEKTVQKLVHYSTFFHVPSVTRDNSIPCSRARCSIWNINFEFAALVAQRFCVFISRLCGDLKKKKEASIRLSYWLVAFSTENWIWKFEETRIKKKKKKRIFSS